MIGAKLFSVFSITCDHLLMQILLDGLTEVITRVGRVFDFVNNHWFQSFQNLKKRTRGFHERTRLGTCAKLSQKENEIWKLGKGKSLINMNNKIIRKINKKINHRELLSCKAIE
jgi:hypothetical protein